MMEFGGDCVTYIALNSERRKKQPVPKVGSRQDWYNPDLTFWSWPFVYNSIKPQAGIEVG